MKAALPRQRRPVRLYQHLLAALKAQGKRYRKRLKRCQEEFSEEAVHELRVEIRRLLSSVELLEGFASKHRLKKAAQLFKAQLDLLDKLRDIQVQLAGLGGLAPRGAAARAFRQHLLRQEHDRIQTTRREVKKVKPGRVGRLIERFREEIRARRGRGLESRDLAFLLRRITRAFARVARLRNRVDLADTATIHQTRIAFKRFRYMVEALAPLLPAITSRQLKALHDYQTMMGNIQDTEVLRASLDEFLRAEEIESRSGGAFREAAEARRGRLLKTYAAGADQLDTFWPVAAPAG